MGNFIITFLTDDKKIINGRMYTRTRGHVMHSMTKTLPASFAHKMHQSKADFVHGMQYKMPESTFKNGHDYAVSV